MLKKKIAKIVLVIACIIALLTPYTSVFALVSQEDTTAKLQSILLHEGGEEESGTLTAEQREIYDETQYQYTIGDTIICKIIEEGDNGEYADAFYCLDALKSFPGATDKGETSLEYENVGKFTDSTDADVKSLHLSTSFSEDNAEWTANYKALCWLFDNYYLRKQTPEQKDDYLAKAFANYDAYDLDVIKAYLTDDDIDVVQQFAIWYFTNRDADDFNKTILPAVKIGKMDVTMEGPEFKEGSYLDITGTNIRQDLANQLYQYLITEAVKEHTTTTITYPSIATPTVNSTEEENYFVIGPFKINSGNVASTEYSIKLLDQTNNEISKNDYEILIEGKNQFETNKNINEIFDTNYYIYIPKTNTTITDVNLVLSYLSFGTESSVWKNSVVNDEGNLVYQPLVLLTRKSTPHIVKVPAKIIRTAPDLSLRKYIVSTEKSDKELNNSANTYPTRIPNIDITDLKNGTSTTAEYAHKKEPVSVSKGDKIIYEIRVYNEGDVDAEGTVIVDTLPNGLELVEDSEINRTYGWELVSTGINTTVYKSEYLKNQKIEAFNKMTSEELDNKYVQIECKISDTAVASSVLTNVAEIVEDGVADIDSIPANNDYTQKDNDTTNYAGEKDNKADLNDQTYYYKGIEDDDDFEKVKVEGKSFDLSLQKFITKINGKAPEKNREPKVDVTKLKDGTSTNATYTTAKTPIIVEQGDIVLYTLRVYNEGEIGGYAEEVADHIPEGLGFLVNYKTNVDNYWAIPADSKTVKLDTIPNGIKNLSVDDFNDIEKLSEVDVVIGNAKLTSTKLKSSETDTNNLLKPFDKDTSETLHYKDIQIACIVLTDTVSGNNLKNIAEIIKDSDENKKDIEDCDSIPNTVNPDNYPDDDKNQDDHDYENLTTQEPKEFDLSLQKFITGTNGSKVEGREPKVTVNSDGKVQFSNSASPLRVEANDIITYTIRVYNEGTLAGYAKEISDDLPKGLIFLPDNDTNKKYGWKLYDKNGNETSDASQAVKVSTDYLSKEASERRQEDCLLKEFNYPTDKTPAYKDIQIVFKVDAGNIPTSRTIKNIAEITDDEDVNGDPVDDVDSTPENNKSGEDDIDDENIYVQYFDLSLQKDLVKIIINEDGTTREISLSSTDGLQKVEIHRKKLNSTTVKFVYNITVKNEGEIEGYATELTDYIPEGLEFIAEENKQWTQLSPYVITTNALSTTLLKPGEAASVQVVLKWVNSENNLGLKVNVAEISADKNDSNTPDIDSIPNNRKDGEDDIDNAEVFLAISTGTAPTYIALTTTVIAIMATGVALIKKYVL